MPRRTIMFFTTELRIEDGSLAADQGAVFKALVGMPLLDANPCRQVYDGKERVAGVEVSAQGKTYEGRYFRVKTGDFPSLRSVTKDIPDHVLELRRDEGLTASAHFIWRDLTGMKFKGVAQPIKEGLLAVELNTEAPRVGRLDDYVQRVFGLKYSIIIRPIFTRDVFAKLEAAEYMVKAIDVRFKAKEVKDTGFAKLFAAAHDKHLGSISVEYRAGRKQKIDIAKDIDQLRKMAATMSEDDLLAVQVDSATRLDLLGAGAMKLLSSEVPVMPNSRSLDHKLMLKELRDVLDGQFDEIVSSLGFHAR